MEDNAACKPTDPILHMSPLEWGVSQVHGDPAARWLKSGDDVRAVEAALDSGRATAREIERRYGTASPGELAAKLGIPVRDFDAELRGNYLLLACYKPKPPEICVNAELCRRLDCRIGEVGLGLMGYTVREVVLAHELYHYLETDAGGGVGLKLRFPSWRLGKIQFYTNIAAASEIAAFAFAQELLKLSFFPRVLELLAVELCDPSMVEQYRSSLLRGKT